MNTMLKDFEDHISRKSVLDILARNQKTLFYTEIGYNYLARSIKELPSVQPKARVGHWLPIENEEMETVGFYCSECDLPLETEETRYCPNCGAKMEGK